MKNIKKHKKTKRERRRYRERKLVPIKLELPKRYILILREESQKRNISINKIIDSYLRIAMQKDLEEIAKREKELKESENVVD